MAPQSASSARWRSCTLAPSPACRIRGLSPRRGARLAHQARGASTWRVVARRRSSQAYVTANPSPQDKRHCRRTHQRNRKHHWRSGCCSSLPSRIPSTVRAVHCCYGWCEKSSGHSPVRFRFARRELHSSTGSMQLVRTKQRGVRTRHGVLQPPPAPGLLHRLPEAAARMPLRTHPHGLAAHRNAANPRNIAAPPPSGVILQICAWRPGRRRAPRSRSAHEAELQVFHI